MIDSRLYPNRPMDEVLTDLINGLNGTNFKIGELLFDTPSLPDPQGIVNIPVRLVNAGDEDERLLRVFKIDIKSLIREDLVILNLATGNNEAILEGLHKQFGIYMDPDTYTLEDLDPEPEPDEPEDPIDPEVDPEEDGDVEEDPTDPEDGETTPPNTEEPIEGEDTIPEPPIVSPEGDEGEGDETIPVEGEDPTEGDTEDPTPDPVDPPDEGEPVDPETPIEGEDPIDPETEPEVDHEEPEVPEEELPPPPPPPLLSDKRFLLTILDNHLFLSGELKLRLVPNLDILGTSISSMMDLREYLSTNVLSRYPIESYIGTMDMIVEDPVLGKSLFYLDVNEPNRILLADTLRSLTNDEWVVTDELTPFNLFDAKLLYNGKRNSRHVSVDPKCMYVLELELGWLNSNLTGTVHIGYSHSVLEQQHYTGGRYVRPIPIFKPR